MVTSVTPTTWAISLWVLRSPSKMEEKYKAAAATPVGVLPAIKPKSLGY